MKRVLMTLLLGLLLAMPLIAGGEKESAQGAAAEDITLKVWIPTPDDSHREIITSAFDKYKQANPHVSVELTETPFTEHFKKLGLALGTGRGPDVYKVTEIWTYVEAGFALGMPADMEARERKSLYPNWSDEATWNGKMYAGLGQAGPRMLVYNKAMWDEAGLKDLPGSWAELANYAKKLTLYEGDEIKRPGLNLTQSVGPAFACAFPGFLLANGGRWVTEDYKTPKFNEQPGVEALQFWADLTFKHKVSSPDFSNQSFLLEQTAMRLDGPWLLNQAKNQAPDMVPKTRFAIIPPPQAGMKSVLQDAPWKWMVNAKTEHPEAAWGLTMHYIHDWVENHAAQYPSPVYYKEDAEKQIAAFKAEGNDQLAAILETGAVSRRRPKYWRTYAVRFGAWLDKTLLGQSGVKEAIDTAAKEVEKAIAEGGEL